jgi:hypothetical protein
MMSASDRYVVGVLAIGDGHAGGEATGELIGEADIDGVA